VKYLSQRTAHAKLLAALAVCASPEESFYPHFCIDGRCGRLERGPTLADEAADGSATGGGATASDFPSSAKFSSSQPRFVSGDCRSRPGVVRSEQRGGCRLDLGVDGCRPAHGL